MNWMNKIGLTRDGQKARDDRVGFLLREETGGRRVRMKFTYATVVDESLTATVSALPGVEYMKPTLTIRTFRTDLPFASGDALELCGAIHTVKDLHGGTEENGTRKYIDLLCEGGAHGTAQ